MDSSIGRTWVWPTQRWNSCLRLMQNLEWRGGTLGTCTRMETFGSMLVIDHVLLGWVRKVQLSRSWAAEASSILAKRGKHMRGIMCGRKQDGFFYLPVPPWGQVSPLLQFRMVPLALKLPGTARLTQISLEKTNGPANQPSTNSYSPGSERRLLSLRYSRNHLSQILSMFVQFQESFYCSQTPLLLSVSWWWWLHPWEHEGNREGAPYSISWLGDFSVSSHIHSFFLLWSECLCLPPIHMLEL